MVGLGETEAPDLLARGEAREPLLLLRLGAVRVDGVHDEARLDRRHRAEARVAALELLHDQPVRDVVEPGAPVALERGAEDAEFAELRDQLNRESPRDRKSAVKGKRVDLGGRRIIKKKKT